MSKKMLQLHENVVISQELKTEGFPLAITEIFPKIEIQLCIVHQIHNSLKYIASKEQKSFMTDLLCLSKSIGKCYQPMHNWSNTVR